MIFGVDLELSWWQYDLASAFCTGDNLGDKEL